MKTKTNRAKISKSNDFDITKFKFLVDNVLVKAIKIESVNGLVNPDQYEDKAEYGKVLAIGKEVTNLSVGQVILFGKYSTEKLRSNGEDYLVIHEEDVKAVL